MALFDDVKEVVVEQLDCDPEAVKEDSKFVEDLNADSLDVVELVMAFEEKFDIEIPDEDAESIVSVADVIKYVEAKA
jgi:acyl carrier protein